MKKIITALVCAMPFVASAEGVYIGFGYGNAEQDTGVTVSTASLDEKDNAPS